MRVLITDDSAFMRRAISQMIEKDPGLEVVGTARDGKEAVEKAVSLKPDLVTLDIEMPVMDGLTALREIRLQCSDPKPAVLMCSSLTTQGSKEAIMALRLGAVDVIAKDPATVGAEPEKFRDELLAKIRAILDTRARFRPGARRASAPTQAPGRSAGAAAPATGVRTGAVEHRPQQRPDRPVSTELRRKGFDLVLIGSSTGGPPVLEKVVGALPGTFPYPVVVAQHMPKLFTQSLAERMNEISRVRVHHATSDTPLTGGNVYIIEGGKHGRIRSGVSLGSRYALEISGEPSNTLYKPAVNELFASASRGNAHSCLAIVLTGMGDDGALGAADLKRAGAQILAQEASTCVVYGMPRAVIDSPVGAEPMSPDEIGAFLASLAGASARAA
ncbi:MAG: chemotaxis-specific protein-glutamate methyltransferase CheB [Planctomycetota bacterium]|nr:chemotaxis-specific protein-glutamate methyltransferase CheB [Planctomycetota bacterium]